MLTRLMNDSYVAFAFGAFMTVLIYAICVWTGESVNLWAFSGFVSSISVFIKEVINCHYVSGKYNFPILLTGIEGSIISALLLLV